MKARILNATLPTLTTMAFLFVVWSPSLIVGPA